MNRIKEAWHFICKRKWWIAGGIISLYPFYCLLLGEIKSFGKLYTFGLPLNEFITIWIAMGGIIGVVLNIRLTFKRITVQEQQLKNQQEQSQKQLREARFTSGVELLGNPNESARIGGAYNLYFLANEYTDEYLEPVCEILCAHIRTITNKQEYKIKYTEKPSNEIQTILDLLFQEKHKFIFDKCKKNLVGTFLNGVNFENATLSDVNFYKAALSGVTFNGATLSGVDFLYATLSNVDFWNATLSNVNFYKATLSRVWFINALLSNVWFYNATLSNVDFFDATLSNVGFYEATLSNVGFYKATLSNVNFHNAKLEQDKVSFKGTPLEEIPYKEITQEGRSLELTKPKEENEHRNTLRTYYPTRRFT